MSHWSFIMGRAFLLWILGVPVGGLILLALFTDII